jgi:hypothetical protein
VVIKCIFEYINTIIPCFLPKLVELECVIEAVDSCIMSVSSASDVAADSADCGTCGACCTSAMVGHTRKVSFGGSFSVGLSNISTKISFLFFSSFNL